MSAEGPSECAAWGLHGRQGGSMELVTMLPVAVMGPMMGKIVADLGYAKKTSNAMARRVLRWTPRDPHESVVAAAESHGQQRSSQIVTEGGSPNQWSHPMQLRHTVC